MNRRTDTRRGNKATRTAGAAAADTARTGFRTYAKIKDGLILIRGFHEDRIDENVNNIRQVKIAVETYTQSTYPKLARQMAEPFGPEMQIPEPAELKLKNSDLDGDRSKVKAILVAEKIKAYVKDVDQLRLDKERLAADIWSICPSELQDRITHKSQKLKEPGERPLL